MKTEYWIESLKQEDSDSHYRSVYLNLETHEFNLDYHRENNNDEEGGVSYCRWDMQSDGHIYITFIEKGPTDYSPNKGFVNTHPTVIKIMKEYNHYIDCILINGE